MLVFFDLKNVSVLLYKKYDLILNIEKEERWA